MDLRSVHPADCPAFEYNLHPARAATLPGRVAALLEQLRLRRIDSAAVAVDTRPVHRILFESLTPKECDYFAGHYRGEEFRCLRNYGVGIRGDLRVGALPSVVVGLMGVVSRELEAALAALDAGHAMLNTMIPPREKLLYTIAVACRFFELVNRIHPFADGNGHATRFLIWAILGRYGYWPTRWPIEPRPPDPPYTDLILAYRAGNREPLERHILGCLLS
jgi:fido (protein-threonine AMPylation protein)